MRAIVSRGGDRELEVSEILAACNSWFFHVTMVPEADRFDAEVRQVRGKDPRFEILISAGRGTVNVVLRPSTSLERTTFDDCEWFYKKSSEGVALCLADSGVISRMPTQMLYGLSN